MHALDAPMTADALCEALDVERRGGAEVAGIGCRAVGMLDAFLDLEDGLDVGEAWLARIAAFGCYPVDLAGGGVGSRLDAAVPLLDAAVCGELVLGCGAEVVRHIGFQCRLVALEG